MKKHSLLLALALIASTAAYGMEVNDKQSGNNATEATSVTQENMAVNASDQLLTLLATDNKQSDVVKWIGQHKKALITAVAGLSALYCARNVPFLPELDTETGNVVRLGEQFKDEGLQRLVLTDNQSKKISLNRFLKIKWDVASKQEKIFATYLAIATILLASELAQGKDAHIIKLVNKFKSLSTQEKITSAAVGTSAGLLLIASVLSFLKYKTDPYNNCAVGADGKELLLSHFQRDLHRTGCIATRAQKPLAILMAVTLVAGIISYEYMQGKDSMAYKLWNKILSSLKSSTDNTQQPEKTSVTA